MHFSANWVMLISGVFILILGMILLNSTNSSKSRSTLICGLMALILGIVLVVMPIAHIKSSEVDENIINVLDDNKPKTIRAYYSESTYIEYKNVVRVELADSNVIAFITKDGLRHAIRPGSNLVVVTEDNN